jgi:hypothetical protein
MEGVEIIVLVCVAGRLLLGLVALVRTEPAKIPDVVDRLARWWYRWSWHREK